MFKRYSLMAILFSTFIFASTNGLVFASVSDKQRPYEEIYPEVGYKTVEEAVAEFETHFNEDLKLPLRVPPINFTHYFGRFSNLDGDINDSFDIEFVNDQSPQNHYKIDVRPIKNKITLKPRPNQKEYTLKSGEKAIYIEDLLFNFLFVDKGNWQYIFGIDKRVSDKVTPEVMVNIADSIE
ncbi:hypothetical protein ACFSCX_23400 [Bacillus salitolerans]|uniref:Carbon monoxide dehydrogenase n=1 Tax=Bacillus salitolerans TaxID=1437434 RepID=A0ABW4LX08_9BACI